MERIYQICIIVIIETENLMMNSLLHWSLIQDVDIAQIVYINWLTFLQLKIIKSRQTSN